MHNTVRNLLSIQSSIKSKLLELDEKSRIPKIIAVSKTFKINHISLSVCLNVQLIDQLNFSI